MKRKVVSTLLIVSLAAGLITGCGNANKGKESDDKKNTESVIDFEEEPYQVDIQFTGLFEENNNIQAVEEAINEITLKEINCTVNIVPEFIGDLPSNTSLAIAGGEKIDVVNVGLTQALTSMVPDGLLYELDDLIAERGAAVAEVTKDVAAAQKIDGVTYAVSGYSYPAQGTGFVYNKTIADANEIEMHDGMTMEELGKVGESLKKKGIYLTTFGNSSNLNYKFLKAIDGFGDNACYGGITDFANSTTIENIYDTEGFREYCAEIKKWNTAGYLPPDQLTDTTTIQEYFSQQKIFGTSTGYTVNQITSWLSPDFETGIIQLDEAAITTPLAEEFMLGIASTCERPDKAMDLINLIYANADVANLLKFGVEGKDYVAVEGTENVITTEGTDNADHNGYFSAFAHFGDPMKVKIVSPLTDSYYSDLKEFNEKAVKSKTFGYTFDASDFSAEAGAMASVLSQKLPMLNAGMVDDVDTTVNELVKALEEAGINEVIDANQEQLDEFLGK